MNIINLSTPASHTNNRQESVQLINALKKIQQTDIESGADADIFIKELAKNKDLSAKPVKKFVGKGSTAFVFETPDEKILKLTLGNHFPLNRPIESFDVPLYEHQKSGKIHYYLEEKLYQHGLSDVFVENIKNTIKKKGYRTFDIHTGDVNQIGLSKDGKLYLLDPECARYKTVFHAAFDKIKRLLKNHNNMRLH